MKFKTCLFLSILVSVAVCDESMFNGAPDDIVTEQYTEQMSDNFVEMLLETPDSETQRSPKKIVENLSKNPLVGTHKHQLDVIKKNLETIETDSTHKGYNGKGGGAEDLESRVSDATTAISNAVKTMQEGLEADHSLGKTEIKALFDAIDKSADITDEEKEAVKQKAKTWCAKKQDYDAKKLDHDNKVTDTQNNDGRANTGLSSLKEIFGETAVTQCSKDSYPSMQCPDLGQCTDQDQFTVVATLVTKLNEARKAYRLAQIAEADAKGPMDDAEAANTQAKNAFQQMIIDYVQSKFDQCGGSKSNLYSTATSAFSEQNTERAKMFHALGQIQCYIQHIDNLDSTSKALSAQSVPASQGASATSASTCIAAMKTVQEIKDEKFTEYTDSEGTVSGCKTKVQLEQQISDYGSLELTKDVWQPTTATCEAVNAHTTVALYGIPPYLFEGATRLANPQDSSGFTPNDRYTGTNDPNGQYGGHCRLTCPNNPGYYGGCWSARGVMHLVNTPGGKTPLEQAKAICDATPECLAMHDEQHNGLQPVKNLAQRFEQDFQVYCSEMNVKKHANLNPPELGCMAKNSEGHSVSVKACCNFGGDPGGDTPMPLSDQTPDKWFTMSRGGHVSNGYCYVKGLNGPQMGKDYYD
jgi:hypothetical protein